MSHTFALGRGTRQGCPLSPLLFALAIEPLTIKIREHPGIAGFCYGDTQVKVMLYADDTILLGDVEGSLEEAMSTITEFATYSGLKIKWTKSSLMLIDAGGGKPSNASSISLAIIFRYLGVQVTPSIRDYRKLNITPLLQKFWDRIKM